MHHNIVRACVSYPQMHVGHSDVKEGSGLRVLGTVTALSTKECTSLVRRPQIDLVHEYR